MSQRFNSIRLVAIKQQAVQSVIVSHLFNFLSFIQPFPICIYVGIPTYIIISANHNSTMLQSFPAHIQGKVCICYCEEIDRLHTLGEDDFILIWNTADLTTHHEFELSNEKEEKFTCMAYSYVDKCYALGTQTGRVIQVSEEDSSDSKLVYRSSGAIVQLSYSKSFTYLVIGAEEQKGVVSHVPTGKTFKCYHAHDGLITNIVMSYDESYLLTLGTDGMLCCHTLIHQAHRLSYIGRYKVAISYTKEHNIGCTENAHNLNTFSLGGSTTLQQVIIESQQPTYILKSSIHEAEDIQQVCFINEGCLALAMQDYVSLWNYKAGEKMLMLKTLHNVEWMTSDENRLFCTALDGVLYCYENRQLFSNAKMSLEQPEPVDVQEQSQKPPEKQTSQTPYIQPELSIAAKLICIDPQREVEAYYDGYMENRFLFYNQTGCIIERTDGDNTLIELEYHNKAKIRRIKFESRNRAYAIFALSEQCFVYSSISHLYFQRQSHTLTQNPPNYMITKQHYLDRWQFVWGQIEFVALSSSWVAVASKSQIKVFNFSGLETHNICISRQCVAMKAFEDCLAVLYHGAVPIACSHLFEMAIYDVTHEHYRLFGRSKVPVKADRKVKWFGFSQEGLLFLQDSSESVQMYQWDCSEWVEVLAGNELYRTYIQHIENYEIYGFRIEQRENEPMGPTVQPRSIPRRIFLELLTPELGFLNRQQNLRLKSVFLKKMIIAQQEWRHRKWYKYVYSRSRDQSHKIPSNQQLEAMAVQHDLSLIEYVKKLLANISIRLSNQELESAKQSLLHLSSSVVFFEETLDRMGELVSAERKKHPQQVLRKGGSFGEFKQQPYRKLSRLEQMIDMGWVGK